LTNIALNLVKKRTPGKNKKTGHQSGCRDEDLLTLGV